MYLKLKKGKIPNVTFNGQGEKRQIAWLYQLISDNGLYKLAVSQDYEEVVSSVNR